MCRLEHDIIDLVMIVTWNMWGKKKVYIHETIKVSIHCTHWEDLARFFIHSLFMNNLWDTCMFCGIVGVQISPLWHYGSHCFGAGLNNEWPLYLDPFICACESLLVQGVRWRVSSPSVPVVILMSPFTLIQSLMTRLFYHLESEIFIYLFFTFIQQGHIKPGPH